MLKALRSILSAAKRQDLPAADLEPSVEQAERAVQLAQANHAAILARYDTTLLDEQASDGDLRALLDEAEASAVRLDRAKAVLLTVRDRHAQLAQAEEAAAAERARAEAIARADALHAEGKNLILSIYEQQAQALAQTLERIERIAQELRRAESAGLGTWSDPEWLRHVPPTLPREEVVEREVYVDRHGRTVGCYATGPDGKPSDPFVRTKTITETVRSLGHPGYRPPRLAETVQLPSFEGRTMIWPRPS